MFLLLSLIDSPLNAQIDFSYQSDYYFLRGKDAVSLPATWKDTGFDYTSWNQGKAPFRYGNGAGGTELTDMQNSFTTLYLRSEFDCSNKDLLKEIVITADFDDGFIVWINGSEVLRTNSPAVPSYNSVAPANHESGTGENFTLEATEVDLVNGTNHIAIQGFNVSLNSTDFYLDFEIHAEISLPRLTDTMGLDFSVKSGFYDSPFSLSVSSPDPELEITYTLDGSNPQNSLTSMVVPNPALILIDPESTSGRPAVPSVTVRVSASKPGMKPAMPSTRTYVFPEKVRTQKWPGGNWPSTSINGQLIDLEMDPDVAEDPLYSPQLTGSLLGIPSVSIVTDNRNLFDPASGIYVNANGHGLGWERECSVELIYPDGREEGFSINAGLRIRGGYSRNDEFPKHAFRLFFREKYGYDKLRYPLFGDEGVDVFDKIDLRAEQNYAWSNGQSNNSMVREVFSRDTQRDMGQPYTRSRYYHLYLNGMYWGLFQSQERSEARYGQSYFGGSEDDYDVIKVNTENGYLVEATDGSLDSWRVLYNMCSKGFASNEAYFSVEGKDAWGKPVKGGEVKLDLDNLIDFMSVIFYTGNFDSPTAVFMQNKKANNFYAIDDRNDKSAGFKFFIHDAEHSLFDEPHSPGIGLYEDRVNIGIRTDALRMEVSDITRFHPQWIHFRLADNPEYRIRFADRAWRHFSDTGVFAPDKALDRLEKRLGEADIAVVAESARWGDARRSGAPYTKVNNWIPEINKIRTRFIPERTRIVINQLKQAGLYPLIKAPVISTDKGLISQDAMPINGSVLVSIGNPNPAGTIYYTLDGSDPRKIGGGVNKGVVFSLDKVSLELDESTVIRARILSSGEWSAIVQANFIKQPEDYSGLRITELNYHPPDIITGYDTLSGKDLEFIEFKNTGNHSINLGGLEIDSAVHFRFPDNFLLPPKQFFVVASKPSKFFSHYGMVPSGNYEGNLSNAGEEILVKDRSDAVLIRFSYEDSAPWPDGADGDGFSIASAAINPGGDPGDHSYWTLSVEKDGNPFADNIMTPDIPIDPAPEGSLLVYPNPTIGVVTVHLFTDEVLEEMDLEIHSASGKLIKRLVIGNPGLIDLKSEGLPAGFYILGVKTADYSLKKAIILTK
jgi:hypothetical protein